MSDKQTTIFSNVELFDGERMHGAHDVTVAGEIVSAIGKPGSASADGARVIDGTGHLLCPGFTDLHCHLRDPGQTWKEDLVSGTASAAAGGFTTVVSMPNTVPAVDSAAVADYIHDRAQREGFCRVSSTGCLTKGRSGTELADLAALYAAGVRVFTDDGSDTQGTDTLLHAMEFLSMLPGTIAMIHTEVPSLARGVMHLGNVSTMLGHPGIHSLSEDIGTARAVMIALYTKQRVHITHMASRGAVEMVRFGKAQAAAMGMPGLVTCDATFNHLILTDAAIETHGPQAKINPPFRSEADRQALLVALADGTLDALITDHAPHTEDEKAQEMELAPFGLVGFEITFKLLNKHVVGTITPAGEITLELVLQRMTSAPADLLAGKISPKASQPSIGEGALADFNRRELTVSPGRIGEGGLADLVLLDTTKSTSIDTATFKSRSNNTPFGGAHALGVVLMTMCGGRLVHDVL